MNDYSGRNVVVTGGRGALGSALVNLLVERGARCFVPSRSPSTDDNDRPGVAVVDSIDLSDEHSAVSFFAQVPALWGSFHVAGGFAMGGIEDTSGEMFNELLQRNAFTAFISCREAIRAMRLTGEGGRIVNVVARPVLVPTAQLGAYAASKAAVAALTTSLAEEVASEGIFINAVAPSIMNTPANRAAMPDAKHADWPQVEQVAQVMADLGSPRNAVARGAIVPVYGRT